MQRFLEGGNLEFPATVRSKKVSNCRFSRATKLARLELRKKGFSLFVRQVTLRLFGFARVSREITSTLSVGTLFTGTLFNETCL